MINCVHSLIIFCLSLPPLFSEDIRENGFSVIVDTRNSNWQNTKLILRTLQVTSLYQYIWQSSILMLFVSFPSSPSTPLPHPSPSPLYRRLYQLKYTWCILSNQANFGRSSRASVGTTRRRANLNSLWVRSSVAQLLGELKGVWGPLCLLRIFGDVLVMVK